MSEVTTDEFVVTGYVNDSFSGDSYSTYQYNGSTYWTFGSAPNERWVDVDSDGWWDYGLRDAGNGHCHKFDGFEWKDSKGKKVMETESGDGSHGDNNYQGELNSIMYQTLSSSDAEWWF